MDCVELSGKGHLYCLSIGQIGQVKDCLEENLQDEWGMKIIFTKGICCILWCHRTSFLFTELEVQLTGKIVITGADGETWKIEDEVDLEEGTAWETLS